MGGAGSRPGAGAVALALLALIAAALVAWARPADAAPLAAPASAGARTVVYLPVSGAPSAPVPPTTPPAAAVPSATPVPAAPTAPPPASAASTGRTYYVSRTGGNGDGRSWAAAWSELDQIRWDQVRPGDTVLLDGGPTEMVYLTQLTLGASGTADAPVTVRLAAEPGRAGRAVVFGGRATPLPVWGQTASTEGARPVGVDAASAAHLVLDGAKPAGIVVRGANRVGLRTNPANHHLTFRHLELHDNGRPGTDDGVGVSLAGADLLFDGLRVHDNAQDAFQSSYEGGLARLTIRNSWLYNARKKPDGSIWNLETHTDGLQIWCCGPVSGVTVERSVVGPGFMHGLMLGEPGAPGDDRNWAVVSDLTVRDTLFYGNWNSNLHAGDTGLTPGRPLARRWTLERVTSDLDAPGADDRALSGSRWNTHVDLTFAAANAAELAVVDSLFTGGWGAQVPAAGPYRGSAQTGQRSTARGEDGTPGGVLGPATDPGYASPAAYGSRALDASFALRPASPLAGKGATLTSPTLLGPAP